MRIITAREQVQLLAAWDQPPRTASTYYHLTDNPDFTLRHDFHPEINTTLGGESHEPGIFVADRPESWFHSHQYHRPYVAEFEVPDDIFDRDGSLSKGYLNEKFISSKHFNDVKHKRTIPFDAYIREQYGSHGPVEDASGKDFLTGQPITRPGGNLRAFPDGYRHTDTTTTSAPEWRQNYEKLMDQYHRADSSEFSGGWDAYEDPRMGTYDWTPEGHKAWYHPETGLYHRRNVGLRGVETEIEPHEFSREPWGQHS